MTRIILIILIWFIIGWVIGIVTLCMLYRAGNLVITSDEDNIDYMFLALDKEPEEVKKRGYVLLNVTKINKRE